jgi:hypothetical protein
MGRNEQRCLVKACPNADTRYSHLSMVSYYAQSAKRRLHGGAHQKRVRMGLQSAAGPHSTLGLLQGQTLISVRFAIGPGALYD